MSPQRPAARPCHKPRKPRWPKGCRTTSRKLDFLLEFLMTFAEDISAQQVEFGDAITTVTTEQEKQSTLLTKLVKDVDDLLKRSVDADTPEAKAKATADGAALVARIKTIATASQTMTEALGVLEAKHDTPEEPNV